MALRNSASVDRFAVDVEETRRRFLLAREQIASHALRGLDPLWAEGPPLALHARRVARGSR